MRFLAVTIHDFATQTPTPNLQLHVGGGALAVVCDKRDFIGSRNQSLLLLRSLPTQKTFLNSVQL